MRQRIPFLRFGVGLLAAALVAVASCARDRAPTAPKGLRAAHVPSFALATTASGATFVTDKDDYSPGETLNLSGTGWQAGDTLDVVLDETPQNHPPFSWWIAVDANGSFTNSTYVVQPSDLGVTFNITATSRAYPSERVQATFTDGSVKLFHSTGVADFTGAYLKWNSVNDCSGTDSSTNTGTVAATGATLNAGLNASTSLKFRVPKTTGGYEFSYWKAPDLTSPAGTSDATYAYSPCIVNPTGAVNWIAAYVVANTAPVLAAIGNKSVVEQNLLSFTASATDDGLPNPPAALTYSLDNPASGTFPSGATIVAATGVFSWTPTEAQGPGTYRVKVVVSDGALSDFEEIEITVTEGNAAPVLTAIGPKSVDELVELSFTAHATDSDLPAQTLTFSLGTPAAACGHDIATGAAITAAGVFTWTPTEAQGPGTYCARIQVSDGTATVSEDIVITVAEVNVAPVLTAIGPKSVNELVELSFTAHATDSDVPAQTLTFSLGTPAVACGHDIATGASITGGGAFTWTPTEAQGPGVYCARIQVSDGIATAVFEDIVITVAEVNVAPVLTVPASFSIKWGTALSGKSASATDSDLPANTLTFSLVSPPSGMTIDGTTGAISWTPASNQTGSNTVTVKVTDNGSPTMSDQKSFYITVQAHTTKLTYDGATSGQYSDVSKLCATLTDSDAEGAAISDLTIDFYWDPPSTSIGSGSTNATGQACTNVSSNVYTVTNPAGGHSVQAKFTPSALLAPVPVGPYQGSSSAIVSFTVNAEEATVSPGAGNQEAYQVGTAGGTANFILTFAVRESNGPEPTENHKALAGDISKAVLNVSLVPVGGGATVNPSCTTALTGTGYRTKTYTCTFSNVPVETYELRTLLDNTYYAGSFYDVLTVLDPSLGFVTGGGTYLMGGDRVNVGFTAKIIQNKKNAVVQGSLIVIRHLSGGGVVRVKSNVFDGLSVGTGTSAGSATFSGKASYCLNGACDATNYDFTAYVVDGGTPGAGFDKFALYQSKNDAAAGYEVRTSSTIAGLKASAITLTGGNIQVPQPQGGRP